jgi:hypothetical protein
MEKSVDYLAMFQDSDDGLAKPTSFSVLASMRKISMPRTIIRSGDPPPGECRVGEPQAAGHAAASSESNPSGFACAHE